MVELFANSGDPDQTQRSAASDLVSALFASYSFRVSRLQWIKESFA